MAESGLGRRRSSAHLMPGASSLPLGSSQCHLIAGAPYAAASCLNAREQSPLCLFRLPVGRLSPSHTALMTFDDFNQHLGHVKQIPNPQEMASEWWHPPQAEWNCAGRCVFYIYPSDPRGRPYQCGAPCARGVRCSRGEHMCALHNADSDDDPQDDRPDVCFGF